MSTRPPPPRSVGFAEAFRFWLKLGFISFGGPAGQIALMHAELVERRRWISERRFLHALNYCMVLPGPEATQLAIYIGWLLHRTRGGIVAGVLFVLPSLAVLIGLSWMYVAYGSVPAVAGILYGIKPAVVAIVLAAAWRIASAPSKTSCWPASRWLHSSPSAWPGCPSRWSCSRPRRRASPAAGSYRQAFQSASSMPAMPMPGRR